MIKFKRLWLGWGRDYYRSFHRWAWEFRAIANPRRDLTGEGFLICGWHFTFWIDLYDFEVRLFRVPSTIEVAA